MENFDLDKVIKEITEDMSDYIIDFAHKYGAWADWYNSEMTLIALDDFDFREDYGFNYDEYVDAWSQLEHEGNCDIFEIYFDALSIAVNSFKYKLSMDAETNDRYLDGTSPQDVWYGNDKKSLVDKAYSDCNWFEFLDEEDRLSEEDLLDMIEEI